MAVAPIRRPRPLSLLSWIVGSVPNELPYLFLGLVLVSNLPDVLDGDPASPTAWFTTSLAAITSVALVVVALRALPSGARTTGALEEALGPRWRERLDPAIAGQLRRHLPWWRILVAPLPIWRPNIRRVANVAYGDGGRHNLLDIYRHRSQPTDAPTLICFHGGRFRWGEKNREARPLLHHLASQGWTCISANYHLSSTPGAGFPRHLSDAKKVIVWVRRHAAEIGADPETLFVAGSSAGAHLSAMVALTANDSRFQPGFESSDTSISAAIGLYGYYGPVSDDDGNTPSTPLAYLRADAPPLFVIHGANDTYVSVDGVRQLVARWRASSTNPVAYAELAYAQHSFDLFHSVRFENVVDAVEGFAAWVRTQPATPGSMARPATLGGRHGG